MTTKRVRRQQKDIDKTRHRLYVWANGSPARASGIVRTVSQLIDDVARHSGHHRSDVEKALAHDPYVTATQIVAMTIWLKAEDSNAAMPPLTGKPSQEQTPEKPTERSPDSSQNSGVSPQDAESREKLLARIRKLFAMAQETEASPHEAEIALRRCQSLMAKFGIAEKDLETSEFGQQCAYASKRTPTHIKFLAVAVGKLNSVLFVTGGGPPYFRGYEIDVHVARLTLDYLSDAVERALTTRRRSGDFPAGRMAAYDYRLAFAEEVIQRVNAIVSEREKEERSHSATGSTLTVRKMEIVRRECGKDLSRSTVRGRGAVDEVAADAGREDGSRVSLDPQINSAKSQRLLSVD